MSFDLTRRALAFGALSYGPQGLRRASRAIAIACCRGDLGLHDDLHPHIEAVCDDRSCMYAAMGLSYCHACQEGMASWPR